MLDFSDDSQVISATMNMYGAQTELDWINASGVKSYSSEFLKNGFHTFEIDSITAKNFAGFFDKKIEIKFDSSDCAKGYLSSDLPADVVERINRDNIYYGKPDPEAVTNLEKYLDSIAVQVERQIAHKWRVINVRAWNSKPQTQYGPSDWHADGFSHYLRKLLIYPNPLNEENGSIEISDRTGSLHRLESPTGLCVLGDVAVLLHRGLTAKNCLRPHIEITICPAPKTSTSYVYAGQNARGIINISPEIMEHIAADRYIGSTESVQSIGLKLKLKTFLRRIKKRLIGTRSEQGHSNTRTDGPILNLIGKVNIGGGPKFLHPGWVNFDGVASEKNPIPFKLTENCVFPIASSTTQLIYSSHCLEHLNDRTVMRVLTEARRILSPNGRLILKLPDFELVKKSWLEKDSIFFSKWGLDQVTPTWLKRGIPVDFNHMASMIYCGFWNKEYGDYFSKKINISANAYHGPAVVSGDEFVSMINSLTSNALSRALVQKVLANEIDPTFNHQNAWDRTELESLLRTCGFKVLTFDGKKIRDTYVGSIPTLNEMDDISVYCEAVPLD